MIQNPDDGTFSSCSEVFPGCKTCNTDSDTLTCSECEDRHSRTDSGECESCEHWS